MPGTARCTACSTKQTSACTTPPRPISSVCRSPSWSPVCTTCPGSSPPAPGHSSCTPLLLTVRLTDVSVECLFWSLTFWVVLWWLRKEILLKEENGNLVLCWINCTISDKNRKNYQFTRSTESNLIHFISIIPTLLNVSQIYWINTVIYYNLYNLDNFGFWKVLMKMRWRG